MIKLSKKYLLTYQIFCGQIVVYVDGMKISVTEYEHGKIYGYKLFYFSIQSHKKVNTFQTTYLKCLYTKQRWLFVGKFVNVFKKPSIEAITSLWPSKPSRCANVGYPEEREFFTTKDRTYFTNVFTQLGKQTYKSMVQLLFLLSQGSRWKFDGTLNPFLFRSKKEPFLHYSKNIRQ